MPKDLSGDTEIEMLPLSPQDAENAKFIDNSAKKSNGPNYVEMNVNAGKVIDSWRKSLFSYEWLSEGGFKKIADLSIKEQERRQEVEEDIRSGEKLERPILGMGVLDNVEIGSRRATFLTLAILGRETIPVHVPIGQKDFFEKFK